MLFEKLARLGEFDSPSSALEKVRPTPLLEMTDVKRNRRLAKMENFGGSRKIVQTRAFEKNPEAVCVHADDISIIHWFSANH
jgi:hypothetical protein